MAKPDAKATSKQPSHDLPGRGDHQPDPADAHALNVVHIPGNVTSVVVIRTSELLGSPLLKPTFDEMIVSQILHRPEFSSFVFAESQTIILVSTRDSNSPLMIAHLSAKRELADVLTLLKNVPLRSEKVESMTLDNYHGTVFSRNKTGNDVFCICLPDPQTMIGADESTLKKALDAKKPKGVVIDRLREVKAGADVAVVADGMSARAMVERFGPPGFVGEYLVGVTSVEASIDLDGNEIVDVRIEGMAKAASEKLAASVPVEARRLLTGRIATLQRFFRTPGIPEALLEAATALIDGLQFERQGDVTRIRIQRTREIDRMLRGLGTKVRNEYMSAHVWSNSARIGRAIRGYVLEKGKLPPAGTGKGLSWRVHVLPYLGEQELFSAFHLDEDWDSEHNRKLLDRMPSVFLGPGATDATKASIVAITGPGTAFPPGRRMKVDDPNSFFPSPPFAVWVKPGTAVPWTKPEDLVHDPNKPLAALVPILDIGLVVVSCSGMPSGRLGKLTEGEIRSALQVRLAPDRLEDQ